ncbi:MAG: sulfatase-like hydrolase/transferase [Planctomycetes bacterium]|nr:sulfatase-like hydrolase/transferase [Planctomycetota bacterium]
MKIIVLEAIGLHLGYLGCYGNDWVATPNLDRLAADSVVFDGHIADQPELKPITTFMHRSVATGCHAIPIMPQVMAQPRVVQCGRLTHFGHNAIDVFAVKDEWLWIEGPSLLPPWHLDDEMLDAYFDEDDVEEGLTPWPDPPLDLVKLNEAEVLQLQNTYAAVVTLFDAQLGKVLERIDDDTLLCVTARSGLPLGEHGMIGTPRPTLHDEFVHVPLVMRLPGKAEAGVRIAALTQPIDLLPTFLEALAQPAPPLDGHSLWPLLRGEVEAVRPHAFAAVRVNGEESWLLRTPDRALHLPVGPGDRKPQLFVKPEDRWEVNDLYQQQIESAETLEATLRAFVSAIRA